MIFCLDYLFRGERWLLILHKLYCVLHPLELHVDWAVRLYCIFQGLPAGLEVRRANIPVPLHEVIHEALGRDSM